MHEVERPRNSKLDDRGRARCVRADEELAAGLDIAPHLDTNERIDCSRSELNVLVLFAFAGQSVSVRRRHDDLGVADPALRLGHVVLGAPVARRFELRRQLGMAFHARLAGHSVHASIVRSDPQRP